MAIDPSILLGVKPVEIKDPLAQYANFLAVRGAQNQIAQYDRELADRNALNKAIVVGPNGTIDYDQTYSNLTSAGQGSQVIGLQKSRLAAQKDEREAEKFGVEARARETEIEKTRGEILINRLKVAGQGLARVQTPQDYEAYIRAVHADPTLGEFFKLSGISLENDLAEVQGAVSAGQFSQFLERENRSLLDVEKRLENHFVNRDMGGSIDTQRMPKYGSGAAVTVPGSAAKVTPSPNAPKTTIFNAAAQLPKDLSKALAPEVAQRIDAARDVALKAPEQAKAVDNVLDLLDKPTITGAGSTVRLGLAKVLNLVTGNADKDLIMNTEELNSELARATLQLFQAFGVGARGIDTPAERKYLERIAGGSDLSADSLRRLAQRLRADAQNSIVKYNTEIKGLAPDVLGYYNHKPLSPIPDRKVPDSVTTGNKVPSTYDVDLLRKNPGLAPMFDTTYGSGAAAKVLKSMKPAGTEGGKNKIRRPGEPE